MREGLIGRRMMRPGDWLVFARMALRNIGRHWRRSLAATLSIAAGFAAINLFLGYIADAERIFEETYSIRLMYGDVLIHRDDAFRDGMWDDGTHALSPEQQARVERILDDTGMVRDAVRFLNMTGMISNGVSSAAFVGYGYDIAAGARMREPSWVWNTLAGHPLGGVDGAVLGQGLGRLLGCAPEHEPPDITALGGYPAEQRPFHCGTPELQLSVTGASGQMNAINVQVQGIVDAVYREADQRFVAIPLARAQALLDTRGISFYGVALKDPGQREEFVKRVSSLFRRASLPVRAVPWREHPYGEIYIQSMSFLGVFRNFTLAVTLAVVTLSVLSMFTRLIQERRREIGTLRSLGFRPAHVRRLFLLEAAFLALLGDALGALVAFVLARGIGAAGILYKIGILSEKVPLRIALPARNFEISALTLVILAVAAAWIAVRRALRSRIPDCLARHG